MLTAKQLRALRASPGEPNRLRKAMELADITQQELEDICGIYQGHISRLCNGLVPNLALSTAQRLAHTFGCQVEDLFPSREAVAS